MVTLSKNELADLYWRLLQLAFLSKRRFMELAEERDIAPMQLWVLCMLETNESVAMHQIATLIHCDPSNITGIVDRLAERGLIARTESKQDRRVKMVTLTTQGARLRRKIVSTLPDAKLLDHLSNDQLQSLSHILLTLLPPAAPTR